MKRTQSVRVRKEDNVEVPLTLKRMPPAVDTYAPGVTVVHVNERSEVVPVGKVRTASHVQVPSGFRLQTSNESVALLELTFPSKSIVSFWSVACSEAEIVADGWISETRFADEISTRLLSFEYRRETAPRPS